MGPTKLDPAVGLAAGVTSQYGGMAQAPAGTGHCDFAGAQAGWPGVLVVRGHDPAFPPGGCPVLLPRLPKARSLSPAQDPQWLQGVSVAGSNCGCRQGRGCRPADKAPSFAHFSRPRLKIDRHVQGQAGEEARVGRQAVSGAGGAEHDRNGPASRRPRCCWAGRSAVGAAGVPVRGGRQVLKDGGQAGQSR